MARKIWDAKVIDRRIVGFDNGVQLSGGDKEISALLDIIDRIGKVLREAKRGRNQGGNRVRKGAPAKPGRKSNAMPKMQGRSRSKRPGA